MEPNIALLKDQLNFFLEQVKQLDANNYTKQDKDRIDSLYKELYNNYESVEDDILLTKFTKRERETIHFLRIGAREEQKFDELIKTLQDNTQDTIESITSFIKSRKGFELINGINTDFSQFKDEELVEIFGSLFGVEIAHQCVKSLKSERVGSVIGYALSGLYKKDIEEFKKFSSDPDAITEYLKERIRKSDVTVSYSYKVDGNQKFVTCNIDERNGFNKNDTRCRNRIDHCFINHDTKTIVFGLTTSSLSLEDQQFNYFQLYQILETLVKQETVNNKPNRYYGYDLEPFYFMSGRFVADTNAKKQEKGRAFLSMFPNITEKQKTLLAQLQFYSLYGNSPSIEGTQSLTKYNPFIAGCNTLDIYEWQEKFNLLEKSDNISKEELSYLHLEHLTQKVTEITKVINESELSLEHMGKQYALTCITDIKEIVKSLNRGFGLELNEEQYSNTIKPLHEEIFKLIEKFNGTEFGSKEINDLKMAYKEIKTLDRYNEFVRDAQLPQQRTVSFVNKEIPPPDTGIYEPEVIVKIAKYLSNNTFNGREYLSKFAHTLNDVLNGVPVIKAKQKHYSSTASFSSSKNYAEKVNSNIVADFIYLSGFLVKKDYDSDYTISQKYKEQWNKLVDQIKSEMLIYHPCADDIKEIVVKHNNKQKKLRY